jgi:hypothetical protein
MPKTLVQVNTSPGSVDMMVHSMAGLAAKSVNEGHGEEMAWVRTDDADVVDWLARRQQHDRRFTIRETYEPWDLVARYAERRIIKGYILYRADRSAGETNAHRAGMDCSVNVATSLAGILDGIIIDETLEAAAKSHGLSLLADARNKSQDWCFKTYRDRFNRRMAVTQDPRKPNLRDLAIAQRAFTVFGYDEPTPTLMKWLDPLSPIAGWNGGDELRTTAMSSAQGHIQTGTDWCLNLTVLMAGTENATLPKATPLDPRIIDWNDKRSAVSFIASDGDNVQWIEGNFFRSREGTDYWNSPLRGRIPFGWSFCFAHLAQLCPEALEYAASTRSPNDWLAEWGGGYYYPDLFAKDRQNRWELLAAHARRTWSLMQKTNVAIIGFNVTKLDSADARKAYGTFAAQTDGLLAILVFQYDSYEAGGGEVFWVKDRNGVEIPVVSARYSIWEHQNGRERSGTPSKVAREIRETVERTRLPRYDWVNVHVWSYFREAPGTNEDGEDMPQEGAAGRGGVRGYAPATWCASRLPPTIAVVSPEELIWRVRMKHNAGQTIKLIRQWR